MSTRQRSRKPGPDIVYRRGLVSLVAHALIVLAGAFWVVLSWEGALSPSLYSDVRSVGGLLAAALSILPAPFVVYYGAHLLWELLTFAPRLVIGDQGVRLPKRFGLTGWIAWQDIDAFRPVEFTLRVYAFRSVPGAGENSDKKNLVSFAVNLRLLGQDWTSFKDRLRNNEYAYDEFAKRWQVNSR